MVTDIPKEIMDAYKKVHLELIIGMKLQVPKYKTGQYVQGHVKTTNDTGEERSVDSLYLGPANNGSGHIVFKLQTNEPISVA